MAQTSYQLVNKTGVYPELSRLDRMNESIQQIGRCKDEGHKKGELLLALKHRKNLL
jgi:hypothetical protein